MKNVDNFSENFGIIHDIDVRLTVELGGRQMTLRDLMGLMEGSVVLLDRLTDDPLDVKVNGTLIARGFVITEGNRFGLKIVEMIDGARTVGPRHFSPMRNDA